MISSTMIRVWEVLDSSEVVLKAYERVCAWPTTQEEVVKNVICILHWLETIKGVKVLQKESEMAHDSIMLSQIVIEADAIHGYVVQRCYMLPEHLQNIPTIIMLCRNKLVDFRFFKYHKALVTSGIDVIWNTFAPLVVSDHLHMMLCTYENDMDSMVNPRLAPKPLEPSSSKRGHHPKTLKRHMFFKNCIEHMVMEERLEERIPKHGVIVFRSAEQRDEVMYQETAIFFRVQGRDMWVQLYKPLY